MWRQDRSRPNAAPSNRPPRRRGGSPADAAAPCAARAVLEGGACAAPPDRVPFRPADAQALPFADGSFDLVVCQFGVMFFPDRVAAYREARRMLRPGARFLSTAWARLDRNPVSAAVAGAVAALFPKDPPSFYARVPFGYHDKAEIEADLNAAGFTDIAGETVVKTSRVVARDAATG